MVDLHAKGGKKDGDVCSSVFVCSTILLIFALVEGSVFLDGKTVATVQLRRENEALRQEVFQLRTALQQANAPLSATVRHPQRQ